MKTIEKGKAIAAVVCHHLNSLDHIQRMDALFDLPLGQKTNQVPPQVRNVLGFYDPWTLKRFQEKRALDGLEPLDLEPHVGYDGLTPAELEMAAIALWEHLKTQLQNLRTRKELDMPELESSGPRPRF